MKKISSRYVAPDLLIISY